MLLTVKAATHEDAMRFAPPLLRSALATAKSFTIDNIYANFYRNSTVFMVPIMTTACL